VIKYAKENFTGVVNRDTFGHLFDAHGIEVRGKPFDLDFKRYYQIESENRLVWIVARFEGAPIGYACSFWYRDLHFNERVAADDLWYVDKAYREAGVGKTVKLMCHDELVKAGVVLIYDAIRATGFRHGTLMKELGFEPWGIRWRKEL
jgi:hypothetical protein